MFRGSVLILLLTAGAAHAQGVGHNSGRDASPEQSQSKPKADTQPSIPMAVQNDIHGIASALEAANKKQQSDEEKKQARSNLAAQEKIAAWAPWVFWAAFGEMIVTAFGIFLIWRTLKASWTAANEARRQANAAEKSLDQTKLTSESELRAWVDIDVTMQEFRRSEETVTFVVEIKLMNIGKTPAPKTWISHSIRPASAIVLNNGGAPTIAEHPFAMPPLLPGGYAVQKVQLSMDTKDVRKLIEACRSQRAGIMAVIDITAYYKTIFDDPDAHAHLTSVRYSAHPSKAGSGAEGLTWMLEGTSGAGAVNMVQDNSAPAFAT
jgi:hypothetical protein